MQEEEVIIKMSIKDAKRWSNRLPVMGPNDDLDNRMIKACQRAMLRMPADLAESMQVNEQGPASRRSRALGGGAR